ncbi:hypothetical protein AK972_1011 [Pseudomonas yamanorum]|nr:hypothetical protein AK972_1011 [Pseudomonas yamanorum]
MKLTDQEFIRFVRHSTSPSSQNPGCRREIRRDHDTACVVASD